MFSLNGTLKKKSGLVGRLETKQFIGIGLMTTDYLKWETNKYLKHLIIYSNL